MNIKNAHIDTVAYVMEADNNSIGRRRKLTTGCGSLYLLAFFDPISGDLMETYLAKGSTGGCINSLTGLSRMISLSARGGIPLPAIVDQLESTGACPSYATRRAVAGDTSPGACCPIAIGKALLEMWDEVRADTIGDDENRAEQTIAIESDLPNDNAKVVERDKCPVCGADLVFEGGCQTCKDCGWARCG